MAYVHVQFRTTNKKADKIINCMNRRPTVFNESVMTIVRFIGYLKDNAKMLMINGESMEITSFKIWKEDDR